ncbi:ABC transporter transmembrane domain-containing protein [Hirsutella rhossiliensis]|uniref:ABC transporter transmembrane domain-containing protein n=1 Tax=Hirsutella rhossiliensis TaxID=111463 RepID=A0A9P8N0S0_9HYPO|nr:ABC transporter transmembrane domain-containing protein [Hirsutella rhossiliensis]KAH0964740.1 ABC transporter transmembrane domain-containing protein [Hirsutella rhossiliensis]
MDQTIRHNIVGNLAFDEKWYDFSVSVCCLQDDLERFPEGDRKKAGSNGASLSGGQRQRVALARAIYSKLPMVIMDNVTSGFDARTARSVSTLLFDPDGYFRKAGIAVVLATHNRHILSQMDSIIVLNEGRVVDSETDSDMETPARRSGSWSVYGYYCRSAGNVPLIFWASFTIIGAVATNYAPLWIQKWTEDNKARPNQDLGLYLGVYAMLFGVSTAATAGECWVFFIRIINNTALKLHSDLLEATLRAPFHFFQATDVGVIANRFSQDMDLIDMTLPSQAIQFTTGAVSCAVQLIIICILGKYLAATIPALVGALVVIQRYYLRTSRQVRLIDIEAKAPLYKLFIETIQGVSSIRAFRWGRAFCRDNSEILNQSQKPYYMLLCVQQWLALVLDLVVGALAVIIVALAMSLNGNISAGGLGASLVLILQFNSLLTQSVQAWTKLETSIGAVARVQQFLRVTPAEPDGASPPTYWPNRGELQFHKLTASYSASCRSSPVLKNLSLTVQAGERLAICGTSGSGKSSLIMAALLMEPFFLPGTIDSSGGLDGDLTASEWSHGERQLLCLARAMLVPSKVLILDEAAGSVDEKTEAIMQEILDSDFQGRTLISVLHRLTYIRRFDRVAVLENGELIECDTPGRLLSRDSAFARLYRAHTGQH